MKMTYEEQMEKLKAKKERLKAAEKQLRAQQKDKEKKARTKLLMEIGEIVEFSLGRELEEEDKDRLKMFLEREKKESKSFAREMRCNSTVQPNA